MSYARPRGFTLIELLTVVAIIAILASMIFIVGPGVIERAKIVRFTNACNQIRTSCVGYLTKNSDTYPPAYGYWLDKSKKARWDAGEALPDEELFHLTPYLAKIQRFRTFDLYDEFAMDSHDTDRDGVLSLLEFSPMGAETAPNRYEFPTEVYRGSNLPGEVNRQMSTQRPIAYLPVNRKQFEKVELYYYRVSQISGREQDGWYAQCWLPDESLPDGNPLAQLSFPATKYDDFVLVSVGPGASTSGVLTPPPGFIDDLTSSGIPEEDWYHIFALRAFYLANRDLNNNGQPDFDFRGRSRKQETGLPMTQLPDGTNLYGPLIYQPKS